MTSIREGFHNVCTQLPEEGWQALVADAEARGESIAKLLAVIVYERYGIPLGKIPKPKPAGRRPRKTGRKPKK